MGEIFSEAKEMALEIKVKLVKKALKGESSSNNNGGYNQRGNFRGRRPPFRQRSQGRGPIRCYNCNQEGHMGNRCPEKPTSSIGERRSNLVLEVDCQSVASANTYQSINTLESYGYPKRGEALMIRRVVTTMNMSDREPPQRKSLIKTTCKAGGKVCKVLIDSSSTKNFVSLEMVEKLKLRRLPHPCPCKVSWLTQRKTSCRGRVGLGTILDWNL